MIKTMPIQEFLNFLKERHWYYEYAITCEKCHTDIPDLFCCHAMWAIARLFGRLTKEETDKWRERNIAWMAYLSERYKMDFDDVRFF